MPKYFYTAKSLEGETLTGNTVALDERELAQTLKAQGMFLIQAALQDQGKKSFLHKSINLFGVSATEKIMMTRNMGVMFSTGLSLTKIFEILSVQTKNKQLQAALIDIKEKINKGENLSEAMSRYPKIFSELFVNMVRVGEEAGNLDEIFQILSLQLTKDHELKSKITNAMIYPGIIVAVMGVIGGIIITVVLPALNTFFTSLNVNIPIYTRILLWLGNFVLNQWYVVLALLAVVVVALVMVLRTPQGKRSLDTWLLKLPLISPIIKKSNSASLVRSLSSLITSGVSIVRALEISSKTLGNHYFKDAVMEASVQIKKGEKMSNALRPHQTLFPVGVIEMVEVGEETGKTAEILKKLADFYEQEAINAIEKLTLIIEPALIVFLGVCVGFFAFSIIQPMYSSLRNIGA